MVERSTPTVIGVDFGTDSVRTVLVDVYTGEEYSSFVSRYPRWKQGLYCQPLQNQWRQHPLDYLESLEIAIREMMSAFSGIQEHPVIGIGVDTTGSTPVAVDREGTPLSLLPEFRDNPNAMFILWKDHTATGEAEEINQLARSWHTDYTRFAGGVYSSEWFWAKILHIYRQDPQVQASAYSWVEHCDWIPFVLSGQKDIHDMKRSRCAAGHKALWHSDFDGLPENAFWKRLDQRLDGLRSRLYQITYTSNQVAGHLSEEWAERLGLPAGIPIAVGAFDAHMGAVGAEIEPYYLSKVMGTSTCDMLMAPSDEVGSRLIRGICGQVEGSIVPGFMGLEAGQSAFGDVYAWFIELMKWPLRVLSTDQIVQGEITNSDLGQRLLEIVSAEAEKVDPLQSGLLALDWLNGRRTPDANQKLTGAITGLALGTDAPMIFRALVEATCYGAKNIVERFIEEGIPVKGIIGLGGIPQKSPFIMQTMATILDMPIKISASQQACALGAAMFAATASGQYGNVEQAMQKMGQGFQKTYQPQKDLVEVYQKKYLEYKQLGKMIEKMNDAI